jgi:hypothetical protein
VPANEVSGGPVDVEPGDVEVAALVGDGDDLAVSLCRDVHELPARREPGDAGRGVRAERRVELTGVAAVPVRHAVRRLGGGRRRHGQHREEEPEAGQHGECSGTSG